MAKYWVTYACGHEERIELFGKETERQKRIQWLETKPCPACILKATLEKNSNDDYPITGGTDKQIAWAFDLREKFRMGKRTLEDMAAKHGPLDDFGQKFMDFVEEMAKNTSARFWIDTRADYLETADGIRSYYDRARNALKA